VFDHYGVGFSLPLPLPRRRSLPASPPSLLLLLLLLLNAVGGGLIWRGGHCSLLTPVPHGSHLSVAFTPSDAIMLTALSAPGLTPRLRLDDDGLQTVLSC
jgi:hypothetical protein